MKKTPWIVGAATVCVVAVGGGGTAFAIPLALVAGGASGLVALTREFGGDERMVAVIQYLRVALVTVTIPVVASLVFGAENGAAAPGPDTWSAETLSTFTSLATARAEA